MYFLYLGRVRNGRCNMALVDILQVAHSMTQFGKNYLNVYHAERANSGESAQDVGDSWVNSIWPAILLQQVDTIVNNNIVTFNLGDSLDFHTQSLSAFTGSRVTTDSPSFIAGGVRFASKNRDVRSGHKRFAGMSEGDYTDGVLVAAADTLLTNIADDLVANWLASADSHHVANYIIVKRVCSEVDPVTGKCLKYRLPETDGELVFYTPTSHIVNQEITSQVSRKVF